MLTLGVAGCGVNQIPTLDEQAKAPWSQVLNQYQRRADLIPNIVETVKGVTAAKWGRMKIMIDLDRLVAEGKITPAEYDKFSRCAARDTSALAFNILVGFGVIAVSAGALTLLPNPATAMVLGVIISAAGIILIQLG